jgi:Domain of unknown function (DUF1906)
MTQVIEVPDGAKGFDCDQALTTVKAQNAVSDGYKFVARYIRRLQSHSYELNAAEAIAILEGGLALFAVQHVESASAWVPSGAKGMQNGKTAVTEARGIGLPAGVSVACDLEGVAAGVSPATIIDYLKQWYAPVKDAGFLPVLYVGWHCGLSADELYHNLPFQRYWSSYNLNSDQFPSVRGVCLEQHAAGDGETPAGIAQIDTDRADVDTLGGRISVLAPDEWGV